MLRQELAVRFFLIQFLWTDCLVGHPELLSNVALEARDGAC